MTCFHKKAFNYCKTLFCRLFPQKTIFIQDSGEGNAVNCNTSPCGQGITVVFHGSNNTVVIGDKCIFHGAKNRIFIQGDGNSVTIGSRTTFDKDVLLVAAESTNITIGEDCMLAAGVTIRTSDQHPIYRDGERINAAANVIIGNHVWLGAKAVVMKGCRVGDGSVVGLGSIVTNDLPMNCIAAGTPSRAISQEITWKRTFND